MSPFPHPRRLLVAVVLALGSSLVSGQTAVSSFGPVTVVDKVLEGPLAKVDSNVRQAQAHVRDVLARQGAGRHLVDLSVDKIWQVRENGAMELYVWLTAVTDVEIGLLQRQGVQVLNTEPEYMKAVHGWVPVEAIERVAALAVVRRISFPDYCRTRIGAATTQGDSFHRCNLVRTRGINGNGIKVGIISNGVDNRNLSAANGDLPETSPGSNVAQIEINPALPGSGDEGTAILEIVHDLAPQATLAFSAAYNSLTFVNAINWMANTAHCQVIGDDVGSFAEPFFSDGGVALAARNAVLNSGAVYVAAAGNDAQNHYQGTFTPVNVVPAFAPGPAWTLHDFGGADHSLNLTIPAGGASFLVVLQWDEAYGNSSTDYDLYLTNSGETTTIASSTNSQIGAGSVPFELISTNASAGTYKLWIRKWSGTNRPVELFVIQTGGTPVVSLMAEYDVVSDSIFGQCAVSEVLSVAAVNSGTATPWSTPAYYSSQGPSTIRVPGVVLRQTPSLTAVDGVSVTGVGGFPSPFYGTSAAMPHVAGVAALLRSASPYMPPLQVNAAITGACYEAGSPGYDNAFGNGQLDAVTTIGRAVPNATFDIQQGSCSYVFPFGVGSGGDVEGISMSFGALAFPMQAPNGAGFPTHGPGFGIVKAIGPVNTSPPGYAGGGSELYLRLIPMTLRWDFYNAEAFPTVAYNDSIRIDIVGPDGATVIANLASANSLTGSFSTLPVNPGCGANTAYPLLPVGPKLLPIPQLPGGAYVRIACWNGGDNQFSSSVAVDLDPTPRMTYYSNGPGSIGLLVTAGPALGVSFDAVSLVHGAYPNGWLFGLDISFNELAAQFGAGAPYLAGLSFTGSYNFGPICCVPSGLTLYSVTMIAPTLNGLPGYVTVPQSYTIP